MIICKKVKDGGEESNAWAYFLIEWKKVCSVAILRFDGKSREAFHNHAFDAWSWILSGRLKEEHLNGDTNPLLPSLKPVFTGRSTFHRVSSETPSGWALSFRGPWSKTWKEYRPADEKMVGLMNGRVEFPIEAGVHNGQVQTEDQSNYQGAF